MKAIDVIIVSDAKNGYLQKLTETAIDTAINNENNVFVKVIVVEKQDIVYKNCKTIKQVGEFCYNRFLNEGAEIGDSEYICFANNDLVFGHNWASEIIHAIEKEKVSSACPFCHLSNVKNDSGYYQKTGNHFGANVRKEFVGFCFVWKRSLWEKVCGLDERISFWTSDDSAAEQLSIADEKHILCTTSFVSHLSYGSNSLNSLQLHEKNELMHEQVRKFNRLYNKNLFNLGTDISTGDDITAIVPIYGDIEKWTPLAQRANKSILAQTMPVKNSLISIGGTLQNARNTPALNANTGWILFVDADDTIDENYVEEILKVASDADIVFPSAHRYFQDGTIDDSNKWYEPKDLLSGNYIVIGALIRTDLFRRLGGFKDLPQLEDFEFFLRAEESGARFKQCKKAIYKINVREGSRNVNQDLAPQIIYEAKKRRNLI